MNVFAFTSEKVVAWTDLAAIDYHVRFPRLRIAETVRTIRNQF